jgi:hypothetical protein
MQRETHTRMRNGRAVFACRSCSARPFTLLALCALLAAWFAMSAPGALAAQAPANAPASANPPAAAPRQPQAQPLLDSKDTKAKPSPAVLAPLPAPVAPPAPPPPNWPINDKPIAANVTWDSQGLHIVADNSSLDEILKTVSTDTGAKVEGLGTDQRIFGSYGPGPARLVLSQLLDGTGYNVLMIGDQGEGTPRQIVLSLAPTGPPPPNANRPQNNDEEIEMDQEPPQEPPPYPYQPPEQRQYQPPEQQPGAPPRTPQQFLLEMQQRQQQIQEQNGQQNNNQPQNQQ